MPSLLATCKELFGTADLYKVLEAEKTASSGQIKKAYHKASLKVHPDRVPEDRRAACTQQFQCVGAVFAVLSDPAKRALYDESGEVDEEGDMLNDPDKDWVEYWRNLFPKVTLADVKRFEAEYRQSSEEREDVKKAYLEAEGVMEQVIDTVLCSTEEDEDRFREMIEEMIENKEVKRFAAFNKIAKKEKSRRKRVAEEEAAEAEVAAAELGLNGGEDSLRSMILARQANRGAQAESFLDGLAAKYAKPKKAGKKK